MTTRKTVDEPTLERLKALTEAARSARLSPAEEDEAMRLLGETLAGGKAGILAAAEFAPVLPWSVAVKGVMDAWPELKPLARKQFTIAIGAATSEHGKRCRMSLARGLAGIDADAAARIAGGVCIEMKAENPTLTGRDRQMFFNVFIGKGKPWLCHFTTLEGWKEANAAALVDCAVQTCFNGPCPPFTQIGLLRWIASVGYLPKLAAEVLEVIAQAVRRWSGKFQKELANTVPDLPPPIADALQPSAPAAPKTPEQQPQTADRPAPPRRERDERPRQAARTEPGEFDLQHALRQIDAHVSSLRRELQDAKGALRRGEQEGPRRVIRSRGRDGEDANMPPADSEALQRHNTRLEETVAELRQQLEEIAGHHEDVAASRVAASGDAASELKVLLGLKLREDFAEFQALQGESATEVLRKHYREMLDHVFSVLQSEGIVLTDSAAT